MQARTFACQRGCVALPPGPEGEIPAHHHVAGVKIPAQHLGDEAIGGQSSKFGGKGLDHDRICARLGKQFQPTFQRHQHGRCQRGCKQACRVGIEGQNHGITARGAGQAAGQCHQGLVAAVHTVEIPYSDRRRTQRSS